MTPARTRSGFAFAIALVGVVLVSAFASLALMATASRLRLAGDLRIAIEGDLRANSALAESRVRAESALLALPDGATLDLGVRTQARWQEHSWAERRGALLLLTAELTLRDGNGGLIGARRATLLLERVSADTLRVSGYRSRY